ncbi:MAG: argininosuccinate lyase [Phycisphaera sp.]|nr:argininosuccinate lyase [Phycisphaera sp.]
MSSARKPWEHAKAGGSEHDELAARFVESLSYDTRMYKHDIAGSIAHARMLQKVGLITADDLSEIERGLTEIRGEIDEQGAAWPGWKVELEDVHMCIEAALIEKVGDPGRKLHTGRSRNDQVALDLRLWVDDATAEMDTLCVDLIAAYVSVAERDGDVVMPSYTHLQRAQPIVAGGELMAWCAAVGRCRNRIRLVRAFHNQNPLGSGAIAGSSLPLDREATGEFLRGEAGWTPTDNSIDATANRDVALDYVYALSMTAMTLSRWAEQWIIYMTAEFGFIRIGDAFTTGSSMMPQKRNPDMLELIRGRCGNVYGSLTSLLTMCKGITIGYNRDLQEDKRHVFAAHDTVRDCLMMAAAIARSASFNAERINAGLDRGFADATSLAEYLVNKGVPFRTAHQHVGAIVRMCDEKGVASLTKLDVADMKTVCDKIGKDVAEWLGPANVVKRYRSSGNAGLSGYKEALAVWKDLVGGHADAKEAGSVQASLFGDVDVSDEDEALITAYRELGRTLDDLPYTDEFEALYKAAGGERSRSDVLRRLMNMRKAGKLPRLGRALEKPPVLDGEQEALLMDLVIEHAGSLSLRDQLPYSEAFDAVATAFNARTGLQLSEHQIWRVIAKLAK